MGQLATIAEWAPWLRPAVAPPASSGRPSPWLPPCRTCPPRARPCHRAPRRPRRRTAATRLPPRVPHRPPHARGTHPPCPSGEGTARARGHNQHEGQRGAHERSNSLGGGREAPAGRSSAVEQGRTCMAPSPPLAVDTHAWGGTRTLSGTRSVAQGQAGESENRACAARGQAKARRVPSSRPVIEVPPHLVRRVVVRAHARRSEGRDRRRLFLTAAQGALFCAHKSRARKGRAVSTDAPAIVLQCWLQACSTHLPLSLCCDKSKNI